MKPLLLIDTASPCCSVGLLNGERVVLRQTEQKKQAAQKVLPLIDEILIEEQLKLSDLAGIGVVSGPGSFTGMRIGVAIAQGLGFANQLPVIPVSTLAALACTAVLESGLESHLVCVKARDEELYFGAYRVLSGVGVELLAEERVLNIEEAAKALSALAGPAGWGFVGDLERKTVEEKLGSVINIQNFRPDLAISQRAFGLLVTQELSKSGEHPPARALPNYVKEQMQYN
jgi:tRNA threonylcarbamoyladenosine biosynthesis protein TsaB